MALLANDNITLTHRLYDSDTDTDEDIARLLPKASVRAAHGSGISLGGLTAAETLQIRVFEGLGRFVYPDAYKALSDDERGTVWTVAEGDTLVWRGHGYTVTGWRDNRRGAQELQHIYLEAR